MPKCQSCDGDVLRTDAFCGICGAPVPGGKPVVPIVRGAPSSGTREMADRDHDMPQPTPGGSQAAAVVAISDPVEDPRDEAVASQTTIREREQSEPAPVLPLRRRKGDVTDSTERQVFQEAEPDAEIAAPEPPPEPPGPPILASELLRERMRPRSPGARALRQVTAALGAAGIGGALWSGGLEPLTLVSLALLFVMGTAALTPMSYRGRAVALFLVGALTTGVALWQQTLHGIAPESSILATSVILLSGSLLFRAYYRATRLARLAVSLGVLALGAWFFLSGGHESLIRVGGHWQSWAPASTHMAFGLLALLSLTAFMDGSTRAGTHWWAYALLTLYAIHIGLLVACQAWPVDGVEGGVEGPTVAAIIAGTVGTVVAGIALGQVLVVAYNRSAHRIREVV